MLTAAIVASTVEIGVGSMPPVSSGGLATQSLSEHQYTDYLLSPSIVTTIEDGYVVQTAVPPRLDAPQIADVPPLPVDAPLAPSLEQAMVPDPPDPPPYELPQYEITDQYVGYVVQTGDTISAIAESFGVSPEYVLWNNAELRDDPDHLAIGQEISVPVVDGLIYEVRLGDTLSEIGTLYDVEVADIVAFEPNQLSSPDDIIDGLVLLLPYAVPPPTQGANLSSARVGGSAGFSGYAWPVVGPISSYFGEYRGAGNTHRGLDVVGPYGAPVGAAAAGQVTLVSWQSWGYGNHVVIRHADGSQTLYSHFSDMYVQQGQWVDQGEALGGLGCTGYCTGTHLHFEVIIGGVQVDPLDYLP